MSRQARPAKEICTQVAQHMCIHRHVLGCIEKVGKTLLSEGCVHQVGMTEYRREGYVWMIARTCAWFL
jgi:hypothetical protein